MQDPFFFGPIPWLAELVQPCADRFNLPTLPLHVHEVLAAALLYSVVFYPISPLLSRYLAPRHYSSLSRKKRLNWDTHVVSMVQSCLINGIAIWVMLVDEERGQMDWQERVWGYTGASAMVQALAAGYFVWDLFVTSFHLDVFGIGTLLHAIAALLVYSLGFRPLVNYYSSNFILWELSTPFLNIHWFMDKLELTGSRAQLYNGMLLLSSFFSCRLVYGTYQSFRVLRDMWWALGSHPDPKTFGSATMLYASPSSTLPLWAALAYFLSNMTLNCLNFYWFYKMIGAVAKRFVPSKDPVTEAEIDLSTVGTAVSDGHKPRRRKA